MDARTSDNSNKNNIIYAIIGVIILIAVVLLFGLGKKTANPATDVNPNDLPGMRTGNAPWPVETDHLEERLSAIRLPALTQEGGALHIHQHLDIFIDGQSVPVPDNIGIDARQNFISPIHTHDEHDAVIHVESKTVQTFTLGQFFDIWGVKLTDQCVGGYCNSGERI